MAQVALAGAASREQDGVVVLAREAVEQHRRAAAGEAVEDPVRVGVRVGGREGKGGGERFGVEGASQREPVEAERQRRQPALERPEARRDDVQEQRGADRAQPLDPLIELVAA